MRSIVVVGYDRTLAGGRALLAAGREAACRKADGLLAGVGAAGPHLVRRAETFAEAEAALDRSLNGRAAGLALGQARGEVVDGPPVAALAAAAARADLVVAGGGGGQ